MSEHEKYEQVGRLAEEYSRLKGELNHVIEKINRATMACQVVVQSYNPNNNNLRVQDRRLWGTPPGQRMPGGTEITGLLNAEELAEALEHRDRLKREVEEKAQHLRQLAPHLLA